MPKINFVVTSVATKTIDGRALTSVRLMIAGRSMWLNLDTVAYSKLSSKKDSVELDDEQFNSKLFGVLKAKNENGSFLKLVPKTGFEILDF